MTRQLKPIIHARDHLPGGADPLFPIPGGDTLDELILGLEPSGFWKLNESSGDTAFDSSGNGVDLSTDSVADPNWAQPAGPPGEQTADFEVDSGGAATSSRVQRPWAPITGDFTAGVFAKRNPTDPLDGSPNLHSQVMGQGNPGRSGGRGWMLTFSAFNEHPDTANPSAVNLPYGLLATGHGAFGMNPVVDTDGWKFLALVHDGTDMKLYVNGLLQDTDTATGYVPVVSAPLWIGHDAGLGGHTVLPSRVTLSYAFFVPSVVTGTQLLGIYDAAAGPSVSASSGYVLTVNDDGTSDWVHPTVEIDGTRYETVTLGTNLTGTPSGTDLTIDAGGGGAAPADTAVWMPLTTVTGGVPELVWDADDELIPTIVTP